MKKAFAVLAVAVSLFFTSSASGMDVTMDETGQASLKVSKEWITSTMKARCIARGISSELYDRLNIRITALGSVISLDAVLDTVPPRAFHKDIHGLEALSPAFDEMIGAVFAAAPAQAPAAPAMQPAQGAGAAAAAQAAPVAQPERPARASVNLTFMPTSIAACGKDIFVSDDKTVYRLDGKKTTPVWKATGSSEILRIYAHKDSLLVVTKISDSVRTFSILGSGGVKQWDKAVLPLGDGLVSTYPRFDRDMKSSDPFFPWAPPERLEGSPVMPPAGLDILSATTGNVLPGAPPLQIVSFSTEGRLTIHDGSKPLWIDDDSSGSTPLYIEPKSPREGGPRIDKVKEAPMRYNLKPRILPLNERIVTFKNQQGFLAFLPRVNAYMSAEIVMYEPSKGGEDEEGGGPLSRRVLASFDKGHCMDVTLAGDMAAALIVQGKKAFIRFVGL
jgi:hypothetical protein